jgi:cell division septation protein DedD
MTSTAPQSSETVPPSAATTATTAASSSSPLRLSSTNGTAYALPQGAVLIKGALSNDEQKVIKSYSLSMPSQRFRRNVHN